MRLLFLIARQFSQLFSIKSMSTEGSRDDELARILAIRSPYVIKRLKRVSGRFTEERLQECLSLLAQTEEAVKTGNLNENAALEMLMVELCENVS